MGQQAGLQYLHVDQSLDAGRSEEIVTLGVADWLSLAIQLVVAATPGNQQSHWDGNFSIQLRLSSSMKAAQKSDRLELGSVIWVSYLISQRLFPHT